MRRPENCLACVSLDGVSQGLAGIPIVYQFDMDVAICRYAGRSFERAEDAGQLMVKGLKSMWRQAAPIVRSTLTGALIRILLKVAPTFLKQPNKQLARGQNSTDCNKTGLAYSQVQLSSSCNLVSHSQKHGAQAECCVKKSICRVEETGHGSHSRAAKHVTC